MPKIRKIVCPNDKRHLEKGFEKLLLAYEENGSNPPVRFWVHCGYRKCSRITGISFNPKGGVSVDLMPKDFKLPTLKTPVLVKMRKA